LVTKGEAFHSSNGFSYIGKLENLGQRIQEVIKFLFVITI